MPIKYCICKTAYYIINSIITSIYYTRTTGERGILYALHLNLHVCIDACIIYFIHTNMEINIIIILPGCNVYTTNSICIYEYIINM